MIPLWNIFADVDLGIFCEESFILVQIITYELTDDKTANNYFEERFAKRRNYSNEDALPLRSRRNGY